MAQSVENQVKFKVDIHQSEISWAGFQPENSMRGILKLKDGELIIEDDILQKGWLIIDMQSIEVTERSLDQENRKKLTNHLKSADFFSADQYPEAKFEITALIPIEESYHRDLENKKTNHDKAELTHEAEGELTIKDKTQPIRFPVRIEVSNGKLKAYSKLKLKRERWGIDFMNNKEQFGEKVILPEIEIGFTIFTTENE